MDEYEIIGWQPRRHKNHRITWGGDWITIMYATMEEAQRHNGGGISEKHFPLHEVRPVYARKEKRNEPTETKPSKNTSV